MSATPQHEAFQLLRSQAIEALHVVAEEYIHPATGARHLHFAADNSENVFMVGLQTVPTDNTGVAHILEHTALCGSEKYPVRDPFFMMIRRSLNTFMNAFTSSDWTAYPFASKNRKDFNNLLDVYLDAVFFSRLDELDFLQEGHRLEFEKADDASTDLCYKGVVYNEMKGAMSSPVSQLWQMLTRHLYPTTTYHYNSGGDPEHITDLSYAQLKEFYSKHYHPSNAVFLTFGDIPAVEHHQKFHDAVLSRFVKEDHGIQVTDEKRYCAPVRIRENYPVDPKEETKDKTHLVMGWLLNQSFDLEQNLEAHLLTNVLFENSAAPLQHALESSDLGHAPSPLCGLEDSNREMAFACGLEGSNPGCEDEFEALVLGVLEKVASEGVEKERLEAVLHQLELSQREISGDSYPYGLQIVLGALSPMLHGGDPIALLDLEPVLKSLRERIEDPEYFKSLVRKHLLDNPHRVTLTMKPDQGFEAARKKLLEKELSAKKALLDEKAQQNIIDQAAALKARQNQKDDESILPKVGIDDVPLSMLFPNGRSALCSEQVTVYEQGTNGLVYEQIVVDLPELSPELTQLLPIYTNVVTELGIGELDYMQVQNLQSAVTGGISAFTVVKGAVEDVQSVKGVLVFSGKALARNHEKLSELLASTLSSVRFDESERVRELVAQMRAKREQSVTNAGHSLAMGVASSRMSPSAYLSYQVAGMQGIRALKALDQAIEDAQEMQNLMASLQEIHTLVASAQRQFLVVAEAENVETMAEHMLSLHAGSLGSASDSSFTLEPIRDQVKEAWLTSTQVNFCAKAYPTVGIDHEDAAPLTVLGGFLRNGFLHRAIREQGGAYGGGASQDSASASFRFFSYRDPRLVETLEDYDASVEWLLSEDHDEETLEQAILGVVSSIDKPRSPAGEAKGDFQSLLFGRSQEQREAFRAKILKVSLGDLKRVARTYLQTENASIAVISNSDQREVLEGLGLELKEL